MWCIPCRTHCTKVVFYNKQVVGVSRTYMRVLVVGHTRCATSNLCNKVSATRPGWTVVVPPGKSTQERWENLPRITSIQVYRRHGPIEWCGDKLLLDQLHTSVYLEDDRLCNRLLPASGCTDLIIGVTLSNMMHRSKLASLGIQHVVVCKLSGRTKILQCFQSLELSTEITLPDFSERMKLLAEDEYVLIDVINNLFILQMPQSITNTVYEGVDEEWSPCKDSMCDSGTPRSVDSPAVDSPAVDSPAVDSPAVDSPAVDTRDDDKRRDLSVEEAALIMNSMNFEPPPTTKPVHSHCTQFWIRVSAPQDTDAVMSHMQLFLDNPIVHSIVEFASCKVVEKCVTYIYHVRTDRQDLFVILCTGVLRSVRESGLVDQACILI